MELRQVGWMPTPELAAELGINALSDEWLTSLEVAESEGGIQPKFQGRLIPIYMKED